MTLTDVAWGEPCHKVRLTLLSLNNTRSSGAAEMWGGDCNSVNGHPLGENLEVSDGPVR